MKYYNIEIENQVYTLPAPVSAFTDNGWKIASQEDSVPSGQSLSYAIKLQKDGKEIEASVTNFADYRQNRKTVRLVLYIFMQMIQKIQK